MTIFTLCSNNYLAQAFALGYSIRKTNPEYNFIIGLVDEIKNDLNYNDFTIIEVSKVIGGKLLDELSTRYDVVELNTALKPYYFEYLMKEESQTKVIYLDPDILVFNSFNELNLLLDKYNVILTPHFISPQPDEISPNDTSMLRTGVYNLGFCAMSSSIDTINYLKWWQNKLKMFCYANLNIGLFTDQIWMVYAPCFVEKTLVLRNLGYNVANWNLHERHISLINGKYMINENTPLIFFHFSNFNINDTSNFAGYNKRYNKDNRPDAWPLFEQYINTLKELNHNQLKQIKPKYGKPVKRNSKLKKLFLKALNFSLKYIK